MIDCYVNIYNDNDEFRIPLTDSGSYEVRENDKLVFHLIISEHDLLTLGEPVMVIGDIPTKFLKNENSPQGECHFVTCEPSYSHSSRYFFNFFGESEVTFYFEKSEGKTLTFRFNILARKENAKLAEEMLGFISDNVDDAVAICFSRSKNGGGFNSDEEHKFSKYDAVIYAVNYLSRTLPAFINDKKTHWKQKVILSQNGQPTGPDSVYWALTNLDKLSPSTAENYNIYFNNRGYHFDEQPKEVLIDDTNVYENIVINSFLYNADKFLYALTKHYSEFASKEVGYSDTEYVRFDHTMTKYAKIALKMRIKEIEENHALVKKLMFFYKKIINSKINPNIIPKITAFVAKKGHYREAFRLINIANLSTAPAFDDTNFLFGLKNLSIVYEITSLIMLHKSISEIFGVSLSLQSYREHSETNGFGGVAVNRPTGAVNNHFMFSGDTFQVELLYEPKIFPMASSTRPGDLIDTSNSYATSLYGKHHFCPDFVIKIHSKKWKKSLTLILDSKYKDARNVRDYDIPKLVPRYLFNIHSLSNDNSVTPIDLLIVLFPHDKAGTLVKTVSSKHFITGSHPALPQALGTIYTPLNNGLDDKLKSLVQYYNLKMM